MTKMSVGLVIVTMIFIGAMGGGCQEEQTPSDVKIHRLIAVENRQLKAQMETLRGQVEQLRQQIAKCEREKERLGRCEEEKQQLAQCEQEREAIEKEIKERAEEMMPTIMANAVKMETEVEELKAELAKLKGQGTVEPNQGEKVLVETEPNVLQ